MSNRERRSSDRHRSPAGLRKEERQIRVRALRHAVPYLKRFGGKTFVIKTGGAAVAAEEAVKGLVEQVALLFELGIRVVLVHGGGPQSTELARKLGVRSRFVGGRRVTDSEALRVTTMVLNGEINTRILAACRDFELPAIGLSGVDAGLIRAHRRPPVKVGEGAAEETVDYGYVGDIDRVDSGLLERLLGIGALPVVSPISADEAGTLLNINADTVASALSVALGAEKLILLGEAPGLLADPERCGECGVLPGSRGAGRDAGLGRHPHRHAPEGPVHPKGARRRRGPGPRAARRNTRQPAAGGLHPRGLRNPGSAGPSGAFGRRTDPQKRAVGRERPGTAGLQAGTARRRRAAGRTPTSRMVPPAAYRRPSFTRLTGVRFA